MSVAFAKIANALVDHGRIPRGTDTQKWFRCPGPHHKGEDRNPSGSLTDGTDTVGIHCHAGCTADEILAALGLTLRDLYDAPQDRGRTSSGAPDTGLLAAVGAWMPQDGQNASIAYNYTDADGKFLYQKLRSPSKAFAWRRLDPTTKNGWRYNRGDLPKVLYRLHQVRRAINEQRVVWVVEGEKDADALSALKHVTATCAPDGAYIRRGSSKWLPEYTEALRGADVILVPDRDADGEAHARNVAAEILGVVNSLEVAQAATGKDAADHLDAGLTIDQFVTIATPKPYVFTPYDPETGEILANVA